MKSLLSSNCTFNAISLAAVITGVTSVYAAENPILEELLVTSQFRDVSLLNMAGSVSVFNQEDILARGATHLDQLLNMAPNVNFSAGASRGRFIQIRGIGERSQFVDPINPSVGLIVDGIDFTGLGLAANTLDIEQVEILRGPQGTLYGANALAGLIYLNSHSPSDTFTANIATEFSEYNGKTLSAVVSGPISERVKYRLAAQNQQSDGYIDNAFLQRDDTNNIDESVVRGKLQLDASEELQLNFTAVYIDVDNGYDAFSLYNTRETLSDEPGRDSQESVAVATNALWSGAQSFDLQATVSLADSDTEYGYDEDWTYAGFPGGYSSTDNYQRERDNISADIRLLSKPSNKIFNGMTGWVAGVYLRAEDESLLRNNSFESDFGTENYAVYGQLDTAINDQFDIVVGTRVERRNADYSDSTGINKNNDESLWGGHIALEYQLQEDLLIYGLVSRGYKAGGINSKIISAAQTNADITADMFEFDTESMLNYEVGVKGAWLDDRLHMQLAAFYQDRKDVQAKQSIFNPADFSFDDFLTNAASGNTSGIELDVNYRVNNRLRLFASAGWLEAEFDDFKSVTHVDFALTNIPVNLGGRDLAHAPNYQFFVGSEIALTQRLLLRVEVEGKDEFYFSNSHDEKSSAYELVNARLSYQRESWTLSVWGRNLTDKDYQTRGFYFSHFFGNNPENGYAPEPYYQLGEPKVLGVSGNYSF